MSGNKVFIGTSDGCRLFEFNIANQTYNNIPLVLPGWAPGYCGPNNANVAIVSAMTAPDGMLYFGTYLTGGLFEMHPTTYAIRDFGFVEPTICTYCYPLIGAVECVLRAR